MGTDYIGSEDPSEEANGMSEARNLGSKIDRRDGFSVFLPSRPRFPTPFTHILPLLTPLATRYAVPSGPTACRGEEWDVERLETDDRGR